MAYSHTMSLPFGHPADCKILLNTALGNSVLDKPYMYGRTRLKKTKKTGAPYLTASVVLLFSIASHLPIALKYDFDWTLDDLVGELAISVALCWLSSRQIKITPLLD